MRQFYQQNATTPSVQVQVSQDSLNAVVFVCADGIASKCAANNHLRCAAPVAYSEAPLFLAYLLFFTRAHTFELGLFFCAVGSTDGACDHHLAPWPCRAPHSHCPLRRVALPHSCSLSLAHSLATSAHCL